MEMPCQVPFKERLAAQLQGVWSADMFSCRELPYLRSCPSWGSLQPGLLDGLRRPGHWPNVKVIIFSRAPYLFGGGFSENAWQFNFFLCPIPASTLIPSQILFPKNHLAPQTSSLHLLENSACSQEQGWNKAISIYTKTEILPPKDSF